ncbi:MAG: rRNA maturation RNase YbeY [Oscillospiraceae bacterium]|jgi:probable rRNA maturation factor|nr:rRNA maturation RNase YbeY [Oscillospiraceae bacterium]
MNHKIYVRNKLPERLPRVSAILVRRVIKAALSLEGVEQACEVNVLITDDTEVRSVNREYMGRDEPTDVLSFPLFSFTPGAFDGSNGETDPASGLLPLGDIIISAERTEAQAAERGHSLEREASCLVVHAILHLLGYDHESGEEDENDDNGDRMRAREKEILKLCGFGEPELN